MKWSGIRQDISQVGEGLSEAENVTFNVDGELRRRPGYGDRTAIAGRALTDYRNSVQGQRLLAYESDGSISSAAIGGTGTDIVTGLDTNNIPTFARSNGRVYVANDFNPVKVIDPKGSIADAGIDGPAAAIGTPTASSGGDCTAGTHLFRYRYRNSKSQYVSNPSQALSFVVTGGTGDSLLFSIGSGAENIIRSTDAKVDQVQVEMTLAGGTVYYVAAQENQTSSGVTISISDDSLSLNSITLSDSDGYGDEPPPLLGTICEHKGRLFGFGSSSISLTGVGVTSSSTTITGTGFSTEWAGRLIRVGTDTVDYRIASVASSSSLTISEAYAGSTNASTTAKVYPAAADTLYWTAPGRPESWRAARRSRRVMQIEQDIPVGMVSYYGDLIIAGTRSLRRLVYVVDPAVAELVITDNVIGAYNSRCMVWADGALYGFGNAGIWRMAGTAPQIISEPVRDIINAALTTYSSKFHGFFSPATRTVVFMLVEAGDTEPQVGIAYHVDTGNWATWRFQQPIIGSHNMDDGNGGIATMLSDSNGNSWVLGSYDWDGSDSGVVTAESGTSGTTIEIEESVPACVGAILYDPVQGEERVITAASGTTLTIASGFSADPADGRELYIGRIPVTITSKWQNPAGASNKVRPKYLALSFIPTNSTAQLITRTYKDFSATAESTDAAGDLNTLPDGVTPTSGLDGYTIDFDGGANDGYIPCPISSDWCRFRRWKVTQVRPEGDFSLVEVGFTMDRQSAAGDENE